MPIPKGPVDPALTTSKAKGAALMGTVKDLEAALTTAKGECTAKDAELSALQQRVDGLEALLARIGLGPPTSDGEESHEQEQVDRSELLKALVSVLSESNSSGGSSSSSSALPSIDTPSLVLDASQLQRGGEVDAIFKRASEAVALVKTLVLPAEEESAALDAAQSSADQALQDVKNVDREVLASSARLRKSGGAQIVAARDAQWEKLLVSQRRRVESLQELEQFQSTRSQRKQELAAASTAAAAAVGAEASSGAAAAAVSTAAAGLRLPGNVRGKGRDAVSCTTLQFVKDGESALADVDSKLRPMMAATDFACSVFLKNVRAEKQLAERILPKLCQVADNGIDLASACAEDLNCETPAQDAKGTYVKLKTALSRQSSLEEADTVKQGLPKVANAMQALKDKLEDLYKEEDKLFVHDREERRGKKRTKKLAAIKQQQAELTEKKGSVESEIKALQAQTTQPLLKHYFPDVIAATDAAASAEGGAPRMPANLSEENLSYDDFEDPPSGTERNLHGGGKATVERKVRKSDGKDVVVKRLLDDTSAQNEVQRLHQLSLLSSFVVPILAIFRPFEFQKQVCFVMPWFEEGDIRQWVEKNAGTSDPAAAAAVRARMREVVQAVAFLHQNGVVHRDLKPENILVDDDGQFTSTTHSLGVSSTRGPWWEPWVPSRNSWHPWHSLNIPPRV